MSAEAPASPARIGRGRTRLARLRALSGSLLAGAALLALAAALLGLAFAGSAARLAEGVHVAGVDVGGLEPAQARTLLERRAARQARVPVTFVAGNERWRVTPAQLGVTVDWAAAIAAAREQGEGFGPVRGFKRLRTRFFGADLAPPTQVFDAALRYQLDRFASEVANPPRDASVELRGLRVAVVPAATGRRLDRIAAERVVVRALAAFSRAPVGLPVHVEPPRVTAGELAAVAAQARVAVSAPVRLALGSTRWRLPRWRIAQLLALPHAGGKRLTIGGPRAERWLARLARTVERPAQSASFARSDDGSVHVLPAQTGLRLDELRTTESLLAAAVTPRRRIAKVAVATAQPELTTTEAGALGITRVLASYSTLYAGSSDRIHNLQLAVSLLDGALIAPGATFSLNERVGERTAERGFRSAPVIIDGEYEDDIGGGVSQVATTVFNAAWEAGLEITARAPHELYISRYPDGRDATVNFPDLDLRFVNDTDNSLFVRASSGESGITVSIYGAPTGRRVVSAPGELREIGPVPVERVRDPTLTVGESIVEEDGQPPRSISVVRTVYGADGEVVHRETWSTTYRGEKTLLRVGTKRLPEPKPAPKKKPEPKAPPAEEPEPLPPIDPSQLLR